ncbi:MAG TPA: DUF4329 domain-containing protein [Fimbriimonadales bacterium]|nr:DUF4329 domain-containing protein [Fimbriimonadales bacterium]
MSTNGRLLCKVSQSFDATKGYDAFGNVVSETGSWSGPFGYGGHFGYQSDSDSGLLLLGHRYYDPSIGRFISRDIAKDGRNWYVYCGNKPLILCDADGLKPGDKYKSADAAAKAAIRDILKRSIKEGVEYAGWIYEDTTIIYVPFFCVGEFPDGTYSYTTPKRGGEHASSPGPTPRGNLAGIYHTHGDDDIGYDDENFSEPDKAYGDVLALPIYLGTPKGLIKKYEPRLRMVSVIGKIRV